MGGQYGLQLLYIINNYRFLKGCIHLMRRMNCKVTWGNFVNGASWNYIFTGINFILQTTITNKYWHGHPWQCYYYINYYDLYKISEIKLTNAIYLTKTPYKLRTTKNSEEELWVRIATINAINQSLCFCTWTAGLCRVPSLPPEEPPTWMPEETHCDL